MNFGLQPGWVYLRSAFVLPVRCCLWHVEGRPKLVYTVRLHYRYVDRTDG